MTWLNQLKFPKVYMWSDDHHLNNSVDFSFVQKTIEQIQVITGCANLKNVRMIVSVAYQKENGHCIFDTLIKLGFLNDMT